MVVGGQAENWAGRVHPWLTVYLEKRQMHTLEVHTQGVKEEGLRRLGPFK